MPFVLTCIDIQINFSHKQLAWFFQWKSQSAASSCRVLWQKIEFFFCRNADTRKMPKGAVMFDISHHSISFFIKATCFTPAVKISIINFSQEEEFLKEAHHFFNTNPDRLKMPVLLIISTNLGFETHNSPKLRAWIHPSRAQATRFYLRRNIH